MIFQLKGITGCLVNQDEDMKDNLTNHDYWQWIIPILIILSVFLFNFPCLFSDVLRMDDGLWYYRGTEGKCLIPFRGKFTILLPYLDCFYSYGMVNFGLPLTRGIYTFVMALNSLLLFYLYRNSFGIDQKLAIPSAIIPNILPSLKGIPEGLNQSYAIWGLLPLLASLLILHRAFTKQGVASFIFLGFAFTFYAIGLNLAPSANFLIPCVLFFFIMFFFYKKRRSIIYGLPFLAYGLFQIYKQYLYTHKKPVKIPLEEIANRIPQFFEMSSFLPFNQPFSIYITMGLMIFGILGLLSMKSNLYRQPAHFNCSPNFYRVLLTAFPLCWMISNSFVYVSLSPTFFRPYDYAYVFNYGTVLLQIAGIIYFLVLLTRMVHLNNGQFVFVVAFLIICVILFTGIQRIQFKYKNRLKSPDFELTSKSLRKSLSSIIIPRNAQILILEMCRPHSGNYLYHSGYLRYLLSRKDVSGIIGSDRYPNNVFAKPKTLKDIMCGFDLDQPVIAFRNSDYGLKKIDLLLKIESTGQKELPRLLWTLYDISNIEKSPLKLTSGKGISSYNIYIRDKLPSVYNSADIAFAPKKKPDEFVNDTFSDQIVEKHDLLTAELNVGNYFTLRNATAIPVKKNYQIRLLLHVNKIPDKKFKLGYRLNNKGKFQQLALWDFAMEGDNLLFYLPPVNKKNLIEGISLELMNMGKWPFKPLIFLGGEHRHANRIQLHFVSRN